MICGPCKQAERGGEARSDRETPHLDPFLNLMVLARNPRLIPITEPVDRVAVSCEDRDLETVLGDEALAPVAGGDLDASHSGRVSMDELHEVDRAWARRPWSQDPVLPRLGKAHGRG